MKKKNNKTRRTHRRKRRYTIRQITLTERLRSAAMIRRAKKAKEKESTSWLDSLPKLPSEPKGKSKRAIIISKRDK